MKTMAIQETGRLYFVFAHGKLHTDIFSYLTYIFFLLAHLQAL